MTDEQKLAEYKQYRDSYDKQMAVETARAVQWLKGLGWTCVPPERQFQPEYVI